MMHWTEFYEGWEQAVMSVTPLEGELSLCRPASPEAAASSL